MLMALFPSPGGDYGELIRAVSAPKKMLPPYEIGDHKSNHIFRAVSPDDLGYGPAHGRPEGFGGAGRLALRLIVWHLTRPSQP
jgi:hypothetical protein